MSTTQSSVKRSSMKTRSVSAPKPANVASSTTTTTNANSTPSSNISSSRQDSGKQTTSSNRGSRSSHSVKPSNPTNTCSSKATPNTTITSSNSYSLTATNTTSSTATTTATINSSSLAQNFRSKSPSFNFTVSKIQTYERVYQRVLQQKQQKNKQQPHHSFKTLNIYSDLALCLRLCGASPTTDHLMLHYNQHLKHSDESFTFGDFLDFLSKQYELERDTEYKDIFVQYFVLNSYGEKMLSINCLKELLFESGLDPLTDAEEFDRFVKYVLGDDYQKQVDLFKKKQLKKKQQESIQQPTSLAAALGSIVLTENGVEFVNPGSEESQPQSNVQQNEDSNDNQEEKLELFISLEKFLDLVKA
ncbi:hypothetical protein C9374_001291 [Naegleria lovaniensis]|uniref:EF-hand domain-containing protein n=1 Tax=Naegleria lovaniensis TaxID=51637 RepID=A0AA88GRU2_NAELO|nr:uncharacterized protein C9374_001291 [Naegleria lovaniensis]KAG2387697.1 hypothetical protein C9374_001291 [Naegleria lovaniensis]